MEELMGLGGPQGQQGAQGTAGIGTAPSSWGEWLRTPENRAFLLQAGAQLMTGGWGSPVQQLGQAIGQGASAQSATRAQENTNIARVLDLDFRDREMERRSQEAELDRQNRTGIARITADSRTEVANIRGQYGMLRAQQAGARSSQEQATYARLFNSRAQELERNNLLLPPAQQRSGQQIMDEAAQYADRAFQQFRAQQPATPPPAGGPQPTAPPPPAAPAPAPALPPAAPTGPVQGSAPFWPGQPDNRTLQSGKGSVQAIPGGGPLGAQPPTAASPPPPTSGIVTPNAAPDTSSSTLPTWEQALRRPDFAMELQTPEGRQRLIRLRPDLEQRIRNFGRAMGQGDE